MPRCFDLNMRLSETSMLLFALPGWKAIMDRPKAERAALFSECRSALLVAEMKGAVGMSGALPFLRVGKVRAAQNQPYRGRILAEIAQSERKELGEVILDLSLADGLETEFQLKNVLNADKASVAKLLDHPLLHFGASDAGAHITQFCGTGDTTHLLEHYVRNTKQMTLERAVHRMTGELARDWGFSDRGVIAIGKAADLVLFDPAKVSCAAEEFVERFPGRSESLRAARQRLRGRDRERRSRAARWEVHGGAAGADRVTARKKRNPRAARRAKPTPFRNSEVAAVFAGYPSGVQRKLLALRELIFATAARTEGVGELEEALRWGEPAYLTTASKSGSPVRIDWKARNPAHYAMYFQCQTDLVETFRQRFSDRFAFEGNRAILFDTAIAPDLEALAVCVAAALGYHRKQKQRRLRARVRSRS